MAFHRRFRVLGVLMRASREFKRKVLKRFRGFRAGSYGLIGFHGVFTRILGSLRGFHVVLGGLKGSHRIFRYSVNNFQTFFFR